MPCRATSFLWQKPFGDPSLSWDLRDLKKQATSQTGTPHGSHPPSVRKWIHQIVGAHSHDRIRVALLNDIKSCTKEKDLSKARRIHALVVDESLFPKDVYIGTALVRAYAKCGSLSCAKRAFEQIYDPDVVSWTTLMDAYVQHGLGDEALLCFNRMRDAGVDPDAVTYICILKACGIIGRFQIGEEIEAELQKKGLMPKGSEIVESEAGKKELPLENCNITKGEVRKRGTFPEAVALGSTLVDMYAKCGRLEKAQQVFDGLLVRNNVSWNVMITGYVQHGLNGDALECFFKMQGEGVLPDARTYASVLKACGALRSLEIGECISVEIQERGLLKKDVVLGTTLVDMYAKCGMMEKAREVLEQLPVRDVVAWNALVSGYVKQGFGSEALECFRQMRREGISQNVVSYIYSLKACEIVGSLGIGEGIDVELRTQGLLREDVELGTALIGMYVKCGSLEIAREVFEWLPKRDIVCWNAMIAGYVEFVHVNGISDLLRDMGAKCILPDLVTFLLLLTACSHTGLVKEGESLFKDMCGMYGLTPTVEHYSCMIDLFGRAGSFEKIDDYLDKNSFSDCMPLLLVILGACQKWRNLKLGRWVFAQAVKLDRECARAYLCMENMYAADAQQQLQIENPGLES